MSANPTTGRSRHVSTVASAITRAARATRYLEIRILRIHGARENEGKSPPLFTRYSLSTASPSPIALGRLEIGENQCLQSPSALHNRKARIRSLPPRHRHTEKDRPRYGRKEFFADGAIWADGELPPVPAATQAAKPAILILNDALHPCRAALGFCLLTVALPFLRYSARESQSSALVAKKTKLLLAKTAKPDEHRCGFRRPYSGSHQPSK